LILIFFVSSLIGCSISSQSQSTDSIINTADRHTWNPADENELEQRRILQASFDEIEKEIESLFLRLDVLGLDEINMREGIKKITPDIESMNTSISGMIKQEESRVNNLDKQLDDVRRNNKIFGNEVERLNHTIKLDPVFSSREYVSAFVSFRKGRYAKSANLFRKALQSNPPYELTDNLLFGLGMSQYRLGNISKVSKPLSRLISEYPDSEKWYMSHLVLALTHFKKREKSQALYILQKGLKKNPPYFIRSMFMNLNKLIHK
jgi:TolA-binding protein